MDELSFNSELAKFKVVRRYDYIKTPLKERRHPAAAAKTAQHRAAVTTASQAPLLPSRAAPAACTRDQDFWDFIREQMDGQLNAAQKETFLGFLKEEISSVPKLVNLDFMDRIAAEAIGEAVAESVN